jgi:hypothetical protein
VMAGVRNILAEMVADSADVRGPLRAFTWDTGLIVSNRIETVPEGKGKEYEPYFDFREPVKEIPPHRLLAINRGEKGNVLRVRIETDVALANEIAQYHLNLADHPHKDLLVEVIKDALDRLLLPGLEREVRRELTERAQDHAVHVFAKNLRSLLLQPPLLELADQVGDQLLGFATTGAIANRDHRDLMLANELFQLPLRFYRVPFLPMRVDHGIFEQIACFIKRRELATRADTRINGQHFLAPQRRLEEKAAQILREDVDRVVLRPFRQFAPHLAFESRQE